MAVGVVGLLAWADYVDAFVPVAIALTTTALGTLLPILRERDMLGGLFGRYVFAAGAVGELLPIIAIALFLGVNDTWVEVVMIALVGVAAWLLTRLPLLVRRSTALSGAFDASRTPTGQVALRWTVVLLIGLLVLTQEFGLDTVLGAFLAGMVLRRWMPSDADGLEEKLEVVGHGIFIPIFFVWSGMRLDVSSIVDGPWRTVIFCGLLLLVRGVPALIVYRADMPVPQRLQMMFLTATALPLLVAITEIGLTSGDMRPENAAALVGGGVLSVALFPLAAVLLERRRQTVVGSSQSTGSPP